MIILVSYILGSIPFGYILIKHLKKIDIREIGSGNIGSTNVGRIDKKISLMTQVCDFLKGYIPALIVLLICKSNGIEPTLYVSLAIFFAVVGHDFSLFLKGKGGKGINTTIGGLTAVVPLIVLVTAIIYYALKLVTKVVSIRTISVFGILLPALIIVIEKDTTLSMLGVLLGLLIIVRHKDNIKRLIAGTEK